MIPPPYYEIFISYDTRELISSFILKKHHPHSPSETKNVSQNAATTYSTKNAKSSAIILLNYPVLIIFANASTSVSFSENRIGFFKLKISYALRRTLKGWSLELLLYDPLRRKRESKSGIPYSQIFNIYLVSFWKLSREIASTFNSCFSLG